MRRREVPAEEIDQILARQVVTIPDGAKCFGVGETNFRRALQRGELDLPLITIGGRKVIPTAAIRRRLGIKAA